LCGIMGGPKLRRATRLAMTKQTILPSRRIAYTSCGYHCHRRCITKVTICDERIVACEPDDTIHPGVPREDGKIAEEQLDRGMVQTRPCVKGYVQPRMIYDRRRVVYPMKREGKRGEGRFRRISWAEAVETVAEQLAKVKDTYGPYSILHHPYSTFGRCSFPVAPWLGAGVAGWNGHSSNGWFEPEYWVLGKDMGVGSLAQDEANVFDARLIVLWGFNPLTTLNGGWAHNLFRAKERGIPIVCIEPRYSPSVEVLADQWIPIRPTTDVAMMIAIANVWFKEGLCDDVFIERWVEPEGLGRWKEYVLGHSDGVDKDPEWAESICGVPAETIRAFARLYARSKPVNLNVSLGIGRQFFGENPTRAAMYLQALSGNTLLPGGTAGAETGGQLGRLLMPTPSVDWRRAPGTYRAPVLLAAFKWPKAVNLHPQLEDGTITLEEYNSCIGNVATNPPPNIRMVILEGNNHVNNLPDVNATVAAMKRLEFTVVFSQYTELPAARYADVLLPQIYTAFEGRNCHGVPGMSDLYRSSINLANFFLYCQKSVDPVGEVKAHDWFWTQVAKKLGIASLYNPRMADVCEVDWDPAIELLHKEAYERWAERREVSHLSPPGWEEFQRRPVIRCPIDDPHHAGKTDLEAGRNPFRGTSSGKIEFRSLLLAKGPEHLAREGLPTRSARGTGKCYGRGKVTASAEMSMGGRDTFFSEDAKRYPLLMSSPHSYYRVHSFLDNQPLLEGECYRHAVWMSVSDAKARSIKDGDMVRVFNDIGEMQLPAYVTSRVVPGCVFVFHGRWYRPNGEPSTRMPEGIDVGGAPNVVIHNDDVPETIVDFFPCKGLVEIARLP
jgi:anaerobic dimethyl sulfoxide reductase subunit A